MQNKTGIQTLSGVSRTLLVPLACRARESARPDALLRDRRAAEVFAQVGKDADCLMGMSRQDELFTVMRARQFDRYARAFLAHHPGGLVVDIGCGLDTRFERLDNGEMAWLGLDLPEVIDLRRHLLPDGELSRSLPGSMLELSWLDEVAQTGRPPVFLAEGVFPYFTEAQVKGVVTALARCFPGADLAFDALSAFSAAVHRLHPALRKTGARFGWSLNDPKRLEAWGMRLLERWTYFEQREPRLGAANLMRYVPALVNANTILLYRLEGGPA